MKTRDVRSSPIIKFIESGILIKSNRTNYQVRSSAYPIYRWVLLLLCVGLLVGTVSADTTTSVEISRIAADGTTVLANETVTYEWMKDNLPIAGDGITHYGHQGPVFEEASGYYDDPWDPQEIINTDDAGALRGTSVLDLASLVGGIPENSTVKIIATDGLSRTFSSGYLISPTTKMGPLVLVWEVNGVNVSAAGSSGDASDGMRIYFFADDGVFGNYDMFQTMPESDRYNYSSIYPSTRGLSVRSVDRIMIYTEETAYTPSEPAALIISGPKILTSDVEGTYTFQHPNASHINVNFGDGTTIVYTAVGGNVTAYHAFSADEQTGFVIRGSVLNSEGTVITTESFPVTVHPEKSLPVSPVMNDTSIGITSGGNATEIRQIIIDLSDIETGSIPIILAEDTSQTASGDPTYATLPQNNGILSVLRINLTNAANPDDLNYTAVFQILLNKTAVNSLTGSDPTRVAAYRNTQNDLGWVQVPLKTEYNQTADTVLEYAYDVETPGFSYFTFAAEATSSPIYSIPSTPNPTPTIVPTLTRTPTPTPTISVTALEVNLYASDKSTLLQTKKYTLEEIISLGNIGDGVTHIYLQGPVFAGDEDESKYWDPSESINVLEKDMGAVRGTTIKMLAAPVGGIPEGSSVQIVSTDGWRKTFSSSYIINPPSRMGPMFLAWEKNGIKVSEGYDEGMRLLWWPDTSVNPWGNNIFGVADMKETMYESEWYYYQGKYPTTTGISGQKVNKINIYIGGQITPTRTPTPTPTPTPTQNISKGVINASGIFTTNTTTGITTITFPQNTTGNVTIQIGSIGDVELPKNLGSYYGIYDVHTPENAGRIEICFAVPLTDIPSNKTTEDIIVLHYKNETWYQLHVENLTVNQGMITFSVKTNSTSPFVIAYRTEGLSFPFEEEEEITPTSTTTTIPTEQTGKKTETLSTNTPAETNTPVSSPLDFSFIGMIIGLIITAGIIAVILKK
ncbi:hypothetical protein Mlab_1718 [Methanocorpusculum labreanum Z]|uniref:PGF-pre-PGF domain-containing protein n=1 Tax=Methanocorpusculum labreanum (strain ATCC 43576 / DSM 4855 / Z) TaxID=410358 RepID=A2SU73_METLZ|nr:hypothetical protein Mlab_1718 [Methanocorpusculum labreanum Z]